MEFTLDPPVEEHVERCLQVIQPLFKSVRHAHLGAIPHAVKEDHYVLGSLKSMVIDLIDTTRFADWAQRNQVIHQVLAQALDDQPDEIAQRLSALEASQDDPQFGQGLHDGALRLEADSEERLEEVAYRLERQLHAFM